MKKSLLLLFLLVSLFANAARIQINFVPNFNINIINPYPGSPSEGTATTDNDINLIFSNYNISSCVDSFSYPNRVIFTEYLGNNLNGLLSDLKNNTSVLKVSICPENTYQYQWADQLYLKLIDNAIGNPVGANSNGNILTSNSALNSIFDAHQVKRMNKLSPNLSLYSIYFDGNINDLMNELNNLKTVVANVDTVGVILLLEKQLFEKNKNIFIYPNPFSNVFLIDTLENISAYSVYDVSGKLKIKSSSKSDLDTKTASLASGTYIINIVFEDGKSSNFKLIKK
jgi:hypothetical protein